MAQAYTPGLKVTRRVRHRSRRILPIAGEVLVSIGQRVTATDIVARTLLPGPVFPINVARLLSIPAAEVPSAMPAKVGDVVNPGDPLARSHGIFGWFSKECAAPSGGTIESISSVTGQVLLRGGPQAVELRAYLTGTIVDVVPEHGVTVEAEVTLIQGIFGVGGEAFGPIRMACRSPADDLTQDRITAELRDAIVIGGARVTAEALRRAAEVGVAAIVTGGIDDQDLRDFLGYDLGVAVTGSEQVGLTLIITEGFGDIVMARQTFDLLASRAGADAAVNGATQIRAGVLRPEVVIPWGEGEGERETQCAGDSTQNPVPSTQYPVHGSRHPGTEDCVLGTASSAPGASASGSRPAGSADAAAVPGILGMGAVVRIIRDPYFGMLGTVSGLPSEPQVLGSGSKARVLEIRLEAGERVVVPRANVELLEH